jgi:hypothetical protein
VSDDVSTTLDSLEAAAGLLERMRAEAVGDGRPMLALLLQLARDEAKEEIARQSQPANPPEPAKPSAASNVIAFPRARLTRRRNARLLAGGSATDGGQLLAFPIRAGVAVRRRPRRRS